MSRAHKPLCQPTIVFGAELLIRGSHWVGALPFATGPAQGYHGIVMEPARGLTRVSSGIVMVGVEGFEPTHPKEQIYSLPPLSNSTARPLIHRHDILRCSALLWDVYVLLCLV